MSPRRNQPSRNQPGRGRGRRSAGAQRPDQGALERARFGIGGVETWRGEPWRVQHIPGPAAVKTYRCPGCDHEIHPGVPHVVVWQLERVDGLAGEGDRRHWHTPCWRARDRRRPGF